MKRLSLKREAVTELTADDLAVVAGGLTGACATGTAVCYSVYNCPTAGCPTWGRCTGTAVC